MAKNLLPKGQKLPVLKYEPEMFDAEAKRYMTNEELQAKIDKAISDAKAQGYSIGYSEGFAQGQETGYKEGYQKGEHEVNTIIAGLNAVLTELTNYRQKQFDALIEELTPEIISLITELAKKIIYKEISVDKHIIISTATEALKKIRNKEEQVVVKVNPLDYEILISHIDYISDASRAKSISFEPDSSISRGGCYIETSTDEVDATIEQRLKEAEDVIATASHSEV